MYIYHAFIKALIVHMIHINLNTIFYTRLKHSPTETIYIHTHAPSWYLCQNTVGEGERQTETETDRRTDGRTDRQTDRQTDRETHTDRDRQTDRPRQ